MISKTPALIACAEEDDDEEGPGRPTKKKKTTPEPPPTAASGGRRRRREEEGRRPKRRPKQPRWWFCRDAHRSRIRDRGHEAVVRRDDNLGETGQNLALVFYEFDKQLGIIDFPKLKKILDWYRKRRDGRRR